MAIIMGNDCLEAIYGLMGWKGLTYNLRSSKILQRLSWKDMYIGRSRII